MNCAASKALLTLYVLNDLDAATAATVRTHLDSCPDCRAALQDIDSTLGLLRDALAAPTATPHHLPASHRARILTPPRHTKTTVVSRDSWFTRHHRALAAAAALVFVCGMIGLMLPSLSSSREHAIITHFKMGEIVAERGEALEDVFDVSLPAKSADHGGRARAPRGPRAGLEPDRARERGDHVTVATQPRPVPTARSESGPYPPVSLPVTPPPPTTATPGPARKSAPAPLLDDRPIMGSYFKRGTGDSSLSTVLPESPEEPGQLAAGNAIRSSAVTGSGLVTTTSDRRGVSVGKGSGGGGGGDSDSLYVWSRKVDVAEVAKRSLDGAGTIATPADEAPGELTASINAGTIGDEKLGRSLHTLATGDAPAKDATFDGRDESRKKSKLNLSFDYASSGVAHDAPLVVADPFGDDERGQKKTGQKMTESTADFFGVDALAIDRDGDGLQDSIEYQDGRRAAGLLLKDASGLGNRVVADMAKNLEGLESNLPVLADSEPPDVQVENGTVAVHQRAAQQVERYRKQAEVKKRLAREKYEEEEKRLRFTAHGVNPFVVARTEPFSTFGIDVDTASYTLTRNHMARGTLPPAEAVRTEEFVNAFDYDALAPTHRTFRIYTEMAPSPFARGLQMLKIGVKGRRLGREEQRPAVLTFLVDTSGSMNAPARIGLVRSSLKLLVANLAPRDRVALIQYDSHARLLLEHTPATQKAQILQAIDRMQCTGSTNLEEGMHEAYRLAAAGFIPGAENRVLLLSDGVANLGSIAAEDILAKVATYRKQGIFCSVFGVGSGSYDDTMLETLANKGDGVYTFLDSEAEAKRVFVDDLAATLNTIASDVKIQVEFNPNLTKRYRQIGYENRKLKKEDFRNDAVDAGEVGSGQSVTALYEIDPHPQLLAKTRIDLPPQRLATVRVRYRRIDNGRVEEIERAVWPTDCRASLQETSNGFRLAAGVAEFAEILRGSPHARGSRYSDVADLLRPIALDLHMDTRVQELLQMVTAAESTPRGE